MKEVKIEESQYGDEYWFGGESGGTIEVAERWVCGGEWYKENPRKLENMRHEALVIKEALEIIQEGKTPRQLAEENAKLRAIAENFVRVMNGDSSGSVCTSDLEQVAYEARAFLQE